MTPNATIGAAQVIDSTGNAADVKAHSKWVADMINAADSSERDTQYAQAMADPNMDLPKYRAGVGELLTLRASEALEVGYSEGTVVSFNEVLRKAGYENAEVISTKVTVPRKLPASSHIRLLFQSYYRLQDLDLLWNCIRQDLVCQE